MSEQPKITYSYTKNNFLMNPFSLRLNADFSRSIKDLDKTPGFVMGQNNHHIGRTPVACAHKTKMN